jgi:hypothetical protein
MEYQVPQFIEVESKIVGPLTMKQFIYIAGTLGLCIVFFSYLSFLFAVLLSLPVVAFGAALAFYKVNGKSFVDMLEAGFNYYTGSKLMIWKHENQKATPQPTARESAAAAVAPPENGRGAPRLTRGKLSELAWSLDVKTHSDAATDSAPHP